MDGVYSEVKSRLVVGALLMLVVMALSTGGFVESTLKWRSSAPHNTDHNTHNTHNMHNSNYNAHYLENHVTDHLTSNINAAAATAAKFASTTASSIASTTASSIASSIRDNTHKVTNNFRDTNLLGASLIHNYNFLTSAAADYNFLTSAAAAAATKDNQHNHNFEDHTQQQEHWVTTYDTTYYPHERKALNKHTKHTNYNNHTHYLCVTRFAFYLAYICVRIVSMCMLYVSRFTFYRC